MVKRRGGCRRSADVGYGPSGRGFQPAARCGAQWQLAPHMAVRTCGNAPGRLSGAGVSGRRRGHVPSSSCAAWAATTQLSIGAGSPRRVAQARAGEGRVTRNAAAAACAQGGLARRPDTMPAGARTTHVGHIAGPSCRGCRAATGSRPSGWRVACRGKAGGGLLA